MDFNDLFQEGTGAPAGPGAVDLTTPGTSYAEMMQPTAMPDVESAHIPAASPQELTKRKQGWQQIMQRFQSDPNLQRALMLVGAQLMQPIQPGQTAGGAVGNAAVVGMNAYQLGQKADFDKQRALRSEDRAERELQTREAESAERVATAPVQRSAIQAGIKSTEAGTAQTEVNTMKTLRTFEDAIRLSKATADRAEILTRREGNEAAVAEVEGDTRAVKAFIDRAIMSGVPVDARVRQALAEVEAAEERVKSIRQGTATAAAGARASTAGARRTEALAGQEELELEDLRGMTPDQRRQQRRGASGTSGVTQQYNMWAEAFDRLSQQVPDAPEVKGKTRDQFAMERLQSAKSQDAAATYAKLAPHVDENDPMMVELKRQATESVTRRGGASAAPAAPGKAPPAPATKKGGEKAKPPVKIKTDEEYDRLPPDTVFIGPDGVRRRKPKL